MIGWNDGTATVDAGRIRYRTYTVTTSASTTNCTTAVTMTVEWGYTASNYRTVSDPLPKAETDSLIQLHRMAIFGIDPLRMAPVRKPASVGRARAFRHLPRGKLDRWPSLKEKRMAWGLV